MKLVCAALLLAACAQTLPAAKTLQVYFIDVEGGQSTLVVSPDGDSLLIDAGYGGNNKRDATRIAAAAKDAGVKRIDYLVITHYHSDHVGGVAQLAEKLPIRNFIDHGAIREQGQAAQQLFGAYEEQRAKATHIDAKPGDKIPVKGLDVTILSSDGVAMPNSLPGAGKPNPECATLTKKTPDTTENARSVGMLIQFRNFRLLDLADLSWNPESDLVCPTDKIGKVDVYLPSHHGANDASSPQLLHAVGPRVAIMNAGPRKGGAPENWQSVHTNPGLEDIWQLHFSIAGGKDHNAPDMFIANLDEICEGKWLKLTVKEDGTYTITNSRNKYEKQYR